jgi:hypothetical protein
MEMPVAGVAELNDQYAPFMKEDSAEEIHSARTFLSCGQPEKRIPLLIAARPPGTVLAIIGCGALSDEIAQFHDPANGVMSLPLSVRIYCACTLKLQIFTSRHLLLKPWATQCTSLYCVAPQWWFRMPVDTFHKLKMGSTATWSSGRM